MNNDFLCSTGGCVFGALLFIVVFGWILESRKEPCELNLKRTGKCVMVYVPENSLGGVSK